MPNWRDADLLQRLVHTVGLPVDDGEHCPQVLRNARSPASLQFFD
jgi:hypothetical protein